MALRPRTARIWIAVVLVGVVLMGLGASLIHLLFGKPATVADLKFPVIVVEEGESARVEVDAAGMQKMSGKRQPAEGAFVIDSDLKMYTQENVKCTTNSIGWLAHYAVGWRLTYEFDLKRCKESGLEAAKAKVLSCRYSHREVPDEMRAQIRKQTTLAGIVSLLNTLAPQPGIAETQPAAEPEAEPTTQPDEETPEADDAAEKP